MTLKQTYQTDTDSIASYDWVDLQDGTGNVIYYLAWTEDSTGEDQIITRLTPYSSEIETNLAVSDGEKFTDGARYTHDYDVLYNVAATSNGKVLINAGLKVTGNAAETSSAYWTFELVHVTEAGAETVEGIVQTATYSVTTGTEYYVTHLGFDVSDVHFAQKEKARLRVKLYTSGAGSGGVGSAAYGHDPQNRDGTTIPPSSEDVITNTYVVIPYKLDT